MLTTTKLLELMSARMFHDLAGPIGAIHNSVECFEDTDQSIKEKAFNLMKSSSSEAILRLKYFRQAYGNFHDQEIYLSSVAEIIKEFVQNGKVKLNWTLKDILVNSYICKLMLNLMIISVNSLIYGGFITINQNDNTIIIDVQGRDIVFSPETNNILSGNIDQISFSSTNIQIYYTYLMLKEAKAKLSIKENQNLLQFIIEY